MSRVTRGPMPYRFTVVRYLDADDGAGGIIPQGTKKIVYASIRGRVTLLSGEDEQKIFGNSSGKRWNFYLEYSSDIARSDFISVLPSSKKTPLAVEVECRVLYVKGQVDDIGNFHHTTVIAEEE